MSNRFNYLSSKKSLIPKFADKAFFVVHHLN
jgi:hypothetical protein